MDADFSGRYGRWAAVTGAGHGMGAAFAAELADRGLAVLLVDRDGAAAEERAGELRAAGAVVDTLELDLAQDDAAATLLAAVEPLDLGLLVSNAAVSFEGPFVERSLEDYRRQLHVNCGVPLALVHGILPRLLARGRGGIVLVSSLSAMRGAPLVAGYAATKAWTAILAESLWEEVRHDGVDVLGLLPGSTRTPGWLASNPQPSLGTSNVMEPADVVREALDALGTVPSLVAGAANREAEALMAGLERKDAVTLMGEVMREMFPPGRFDPGSEDPSDGA